ncbi:MAG TPA: TonB-dependent receptor [Chitinophagaceae bacterium]|nr:TonB-dependent receptor [Chitinophagaceae bacterium]
MQKLAVFISFAILQLCAIQVAAQTSLLTGRVTSGGKPIDKATVDVVGTRMKSVSDSSGYFQISQLSTGSYNVRISVIGYAPVTRTIKIQEDSNINTEFELEPVSGNLDEVVVTGTLKAVKRIESPVPVEVYSPAFFKKNPSPNIFDALQNINGIRPQLNCNVCNTGDIHINGLEGPYTMVLIDGMPIVSSLSTVYGLSGIPNSLVERIEIVKGPASSLYGSEAVGGLINIITKQPQNAEIFSANVFTTSWLEHNVDLGVKFKAGRTASVLTGVNYYKYGNIKDNNKDKFTDVTLQDRISVFQKWNFERKDSRLLSMGVRYFYEDRWGGDTRWNKSFRGGDSIYGESIYTGRWEIIGSYQLPVKEKLFLSFSYNDHDQNSFYGDVPYNAKQQISFGQLTWDKKTANHDLLAGAALRYTYYDDNTPATANDDPGNFKNAPDKSWLPGVFLQDEISLAKQHKVLVGIRYDHHSRHGEIITPRVAYKWSINDKNIVRLNAGTGFRVVNLFTEDHAALTGARTVVIGEELKPERSYNVNLNYIKKIYSDNGSFLGIDASVWYTYFNNRIIADYDTHPDFIYYNNLRGHAVTRGVTANVDYNLSNGLKLLAGGTLMNVFTIKEEAGLKLKQRPVLTENCTGTWSASYKIRPLNLLVDYTGNIYGPMRLPLLGDLDPRKEYSPAWSIQNIQFTWNKPGKSWEVYGGVKNLLNWTPDEGNPFLIARSHDPFDKEVEYDSAGQVVATPSNPYALTFDPNYVFAPNQGMRLFSGVRVSIR